MELATMPQEEKAIVVVEADRSGFLDEFIYSEEQLEQMKMQQRQREMNMKPWEREIQEIDRFYQRTQEQQNILLNTPGAKKPVDP
jgi:hypothetical protein